MKDENNGFVLDASITLAWCFSDEQTPNTIKLLKRLDTETAHVPSLWTLEVGNILLNAEKRKRITFADANQFLGLVEQLNIIIDEDTANRGFGEIMSLAYSQKLTTYDAAYLELAMRLGLPLASKDTDLCKTAAKLGVKILKD